jgi:hypothetical protein
MTCPVPLSHLLVGWQAVADIYNMPVHVFWTGDTYLAVSNNAQGVGHLVQTLAPRGKKSNLGSISKDDSLVTPDPSPPFSRVRKKNAVPRNHGDSSRRVDGRDKPGHDAS